MSVKIAELTCPNLGKADVSRRSDPICPYSDHFASDCFNGAETTPKLLPEKTLSAGLDFTVSDFPPLQSSRLPVEFSSRRSQNADR
jgi:hypothetical protein